MPIKVLYLLIIKTVYLLEVLLLKGLYLLNQIKIQMILTCPKNLKRVTRNRKLLVIILISLRVEKRRHQII